MKSWKNVLILGLVLVGAAKGEGDSNVKGSISYLQDRVDEGDVASARELGLIYLNGDGAQKDFGKAIELFRKAASENDIVSQRLLGRMWLMGEGTQPDEAEAIHWLGKAATQGDDIADWLIHQDADKGGSEAIKWIKGGGDAAFRDSQSEASRTNDLVQTRKISALPVLRQQADEPINPVVFRDNAAAPTATTTPEPTSIASPIVPERSTEHVAQPSAQTAPAVEGGGQGLLLILVLVLPVAIIGGLTLKKMSGGKLWADTTMVLNPPPVNIGESNTDPTSPKLPPATMNEKNEKSTEPTMPLLQDSDLRILDAIVLQIAEIKKTNAIATEQLKILKKFYFWLSLYILLSILGGGAIVFFVMPRA